MNKRYLNSATLLGAIGLGFALPRQAQAQPEPKPARIKAYTALVEQTANDINTVSQFAETAVKSTIKNTPTYEEFGGKGRVEINFSYDVKEGGPYAGSGSSLRNWNYYTGLKITVRKTPAIKRTDEGLFLTMTVRGQNNNWSDVRKDFPFYNLKIDSKKIPGQHSPEVINPTQDLESEKMENGFDYNQDRDWVSAKYIARGLGQYYASIGTGIDPVGNDKDLEQLVKLVEDQGFTISSNWPQILQQLDPSEFANKEKIELTTFFLRQNNSFTWQKNEQDPEKPALTP